MDSRFAMSDLAVVTHAQMRLRRQNLAALCTTAGKNLAAVGSSHSLAETVNLGTVTIAGLIGTLHEVTPPKITIMLDSHKTAATHNQRPYLVMLRYYSRKMQ